MTTKSLLAFCVFLIFDTSAMYAEDDWRPLFNHRDLSGWEHVGPGGFIVEDGLLKSKSGMGLLWYSKEQIGNAVLRISFKRTHAMADSGVFIRIPERPIDTRMPIHRGYEIEIGDWPEDYSVTGAVYMFSNALARPQKPVGEWDLMEITLDGPRILVSVNGIKVTDYTEGQPIPKPTKSNIERGPRPLRGYIGLQNHVEFAPEGAAVIFREVSIRALPERK